MKSPSSSMEQKRVKKTPGEDWWSQGWMQPGCEEVKTFICAIVSPHVTTGGVKGGYSSLSKCLVNKVLGEVGDAPSPGTYFILSTPAYSSPYSSWSLSGWSDREKRPARPLNLFSGLPCLEMNITEDVAPSTVVNGNVSPAPASLLGPFVDALNELNSA